MLPKIIFRHSWLYDKSLKRPAKFKIPNDRVFDTFIQKLERQWKKDGKKILKEIATFTKLKWHQKEIVCYVAIGVIPFSDPLTLNLRNNIDTLTHELIHRIFSEPENITKIKWHRLKKLYKGESYVTNNHVVIHAVHTHVLKKLFSEKRLAAEKKSMHNPNYVRAWKIVEAEGYKNILPKLR